MILRISCLAFVVSFLACSSSDFGGQSGSKAASSGTGTGTGTGPNDGGPNSPGSPGSPGGPGTDSTPTPPQKPQPLTQAPLPNNPNATQCLAALQCDVGNANKPCGVADNKGQVFLVLNQQMGLFDGIIACKTLFSGNMVYVGQSYPDALVKCAPGLQPAWGDEWTDSGGAKHYGYFQKMTPGDVAVSKQTACSDGEPNAATNGPLTSGTATSMGTTTGSPLLDTFSDAGTQSGCTSKGYILCYYVKQGGSGPSAGSADGGSGAGTTGGSGAGTTGGASASGADTSQASSTGTAP